MAALISLFIKKTDIIGCFDSFLIQLYIKMPKLPLEVVKNMTKTQKSNYQKQLAVERQERYKQKHPDTRKANNLQYVQKYRDVHHDQYVLQNRQHSKKHYNKIKTVKDMNALVNDIVNMALNRK